ncbi:MAG: flavodoxin [Eubacteriales bacterium]
MKTLVIFYSLEGNTRFISKIIAKELNADILELKTKKEYPSTGFKKYFWGGKSVVFKEKPVLINDKVDLGLYDNVIIGTPIWAGTYAAPYNTFLKEYNFFGKKIALFACQGGGSTKKCFKMFKEALDGNQFIGEIDFMDPLTNDKDTNAKKAADWAKGLKF